MEILVHPLQRTLSVTPGVNLLEALRANDVPVSYSCMAGRCGTCRCKLVAGHVLESGREMQRPLGAQDEYVLACQTFLTESCTVEIPEPDEVVVHAAKIIKATVVALEEQTHDIKRIRLKPAKPLDFSPGQYAQLQFTPDHIRPYSMAGLPVDGELEFHVRLVADGRVTGYIADTLSVGDTVRVSGPLGSAYLRRKHEGPMLCVAGGTGLAPILSIIRGVIAEGMQNPIHLYFGVRSERDVYGRPWLDELQQRHPQLQVHVVLASGQAPGCRTGLVTEAIARDWTSLEGFRAYLCGAPPMVEATTLCVKQMGVKPEQIYADAFYASGT
ncbi:2Fe-2S iron-sulfur cluster-binding protein [Variovorax sp. J22G21]|uniref:2Fe-2S iron-sulfur cluster-binding protein n=1 Tax=Variovorax fucosicus TaxID=3053517 RepID=UPI002578F11D|nr:MULTISPECIES: 2Fe-2S iron-sulfur cluster-binding protein [unclassified Variovorax]MDM0040026.1 2Fe-2S iron-sulfur cluster-binding protein [Variovorax sp. J22R193]MDM0061399.1 2Fe-2S iron-sulfur cluster-binding protein [Variovorax sp. J22G21]